MTKARDLADLISAGNPLADGAISVSEISDLTASAAELNQLDNTADLPDIRPSLLLDFANSKTLDPRITFTRGSTATYWDGKTTAKAEENLITYSQDFSTIWSFGPSGAAGTITNNNATAPDGTTTAALIQASATTSQHYLQRPSGYYPPVSGQTYTLSCYLKAGTISDVQFVFGNGIDFGGSAYINVDLSAGTITHTASSISASSITDVGSGWYRVTMSAPAIGSNGEGNFITSFVNPSSPTTRLASFTTAGTETYYIWGCQVEQRSSATAYTATTSSPIVKYQPVLQTAASGEARFDHDPVTGESKGLLIEEARTNLAPYSEAFDNAGWSAVRASVEADVVVAPDGSLSADKLVEDTTASNSHYLLETITKDSSVRDYTASVYLKAAERTRAYVYLRDDTFVGGRTGLINLAAGTIGDAGISSGGTVLGNTIEDVGNGWYRVSVSITSTTATTLRLEIYVDDGSSITYTGDGYSGVFLWGAQLEEGSFPTSYIPTSGSTVTRAGDFPLMSGSNFTSWFNDMPFSAYVEYDFQTSAINQRIFSIDTNGYDPRLVIVGSTSSGAGPIVELYSGGTFYTSMNSDITTPTEAGIHKLAFAFADNDAANSKDGAAVVTDTTFVFPSNFSQMRIGSQATGANHMQGTIKKIAFYPKRLPNATLQAMTEA